MFGMGFTEIVIIAIIAILFLGPDKLPDAMVQIAKFFRSTKNTISSMKHSLEEEMNVKSMKEEALAYKKGLLDVTEEVKSATDIKKMAAKLTTLEDDDFSGVFDQPSKATTPLAQSKPDEVTLPKKKEDSKNV
ncbi:Sec-independent protein translocase protein TatB [Sulfurimonas sp.]|uniref:Sec-independent protein translocase protein TatB n=1 Tax=Sulfurimonas sp. TaxID=2022749 RepID=UPI0025ED5A33|nr:Sec-independent protein translocase protein TatB [Sulfurimonas sp.]MBW6489223.1 Sec-independent protein translocase protein TatB [Sulfurimonas sp.]